MEKCVFCKISKNEIPCNKIGESKNFISFLDLSPKNKGHALVVPKKHYTNLKDFPEILGNELIKFSKEIMNKISKATKATDFKFLINNGEKADQFVFHAHFHIVPYYNKDEETRPKLSDEERKKLAEKIGKVKVY